jgi:hypothetical protein
MSKYTTVIFVTFWEIRWYAELYTPTRPVEGNQLRHTQQELHQIFAKIKID